MQILLSSCASCVTLSELLPLSEPPFLFLETGTRPTMKWLSQLTQTEGENSCPPQGRG